MIVDSIKNKELYVGLDKNIYAALQLIGNLPNDVEVGRYEIDGDKMYYMVQEYSTTSKEGKYFEAHKNYIDIQYIMMGKETISYNNVERLKIIKPYVPDIAFYDGEDNEVLLESGDFMILYPTDAHKPAIGQDKVKKVVVKIKI